MKKGIILAGGHGTRLYPLTNNTSKQLLPVFDKPMIYYPISTLMLGGIEEIAIISTPRDLPNYNNLLGDGKKWGIKISYFNQENPRGLADAFIVCKDFIKKDSVSLILGDNIFYGNLRLKELYDNFRGGALIFGYPVQDPERYGIVEFDKDGKAISLEEKPKNPKSRFAIPGLYLYDNRVVNFAENLEPSNRGELEITDLNRKYLEINELDVQLLGRGIAWLDTGTSESLQEASSFIQSVEKRQSYKIGCPEEVALRMGLINASEFNNIITSIPSCEYKNYLIGISEEI
jgi:glucose-1-phosphate thymidylyltransferase